MISVGKKVIYCQYYCGLLPTLIKAGHAKFQLEGSKNKEVISRILFGDPGSKPYAGQ